MTPLFFPLLSAPLFIVEGSWLMLKLIVFPSFTLTVVTRMLREKGSLIIRMKLIISIDVGMLIVSFFLSILKLPRSKNIALIMRSIWRFLVVAFRRMRVSIQRYCFPQLMVRHGPILVYKTVEMRTLLTIFIMLLFNDAFHFLEIWLRKVRLNVTYRFSIA